MSESDFRAFLVSLGLQPGRVACDGRWHRCPTESHPNKKNGSWKLALDGSVGFAQDHAAHEKAVIWKPGKDAPAPMPFDPAALARAHAEERRRRIAATQAAREFYTRCEPLRGGHPYLESHGLDMAGCSGLKVDRDGWLVVPAYRSCNLMTVQRISPSGEKRFWPGAPVKGASFMVERRQAAITVLCEGLATGLAIFASAPLTRALVAFNSGNLGEVTIPPVGLLAIAADNDWKTRERLGTNPGVEAAQKAADASGVGVAVPETLEGSDWCDWRMEQIAKRTAARDADPFSRTRDSEIRRAVDSEIAQAVSRAARLPVVREPPTLEYR